MRLISMGDTGIGWTSFKEIVAGIAQIPYSYRVKREATR